MWRSIMAAALIVLTGSSVISRDMVDFNQGWLFNRYGPMPDGSSRPEPGCVEHVYRLAASSEEKAKSNLARYAFDNDQNTRWCASSLDPKQWISVDFGKSMAVQTLRVLWEFNEDYAADVLVSDDGASWKKVGVLMGDKPANLDTRIRHLRIRTTRLPSNHWASIREIEITDSAGKVIRNEKSIVALTTPESPAFVDSQWRKLDLPHDWAIEGPFRYDLEGSTGKLPWKGIGWYRKHFDVPDSYEGKRLFIDFDGAMANAKVWCNGKLVGGWPYGYQGFRLELTDFLKSGTSNLLAVRLDTTKWGSRWYPGAGIYRNVRLVVTDPLSIGHWGTYVTTPSVTSEFAEVDIRVIVDNAQSADAFVSVKSEIFERMPDGSTGRKVAETDVRDVTASAGSTCTATLKAKVARPRLWSIKQPSMYLARTSIKSGNRVTDEYDTPFGIRSIRFTPRDGFYLNGKRIPIRGVCRHHDLGALGSAVNVRAMARQLKILKAMGCNSIRTSHNPPAPELLDLCDRMGFTVMCEAFDCWKSGKRSNDYSAIYEAWHQRDLEAMVHHFANHPCIILWSIGNEVREQGTLNPAKHLRDIVHAVDPTRPVTAAVWTKAGQSDFRHGVDVFGQNYGIHSYKKLLNYLGNENLPFFASESSSCISSRGEYFFPASNKRQNFQITSYDTDHPGWGCIPDSEFAELDKNSAYMGEYVWTGFDYLGEPTPYNKDMTNLLNIHDKDPKKMAAMKKELERLGRIRVPSKSSYFGIVDLAGFPKDRYYIYQARWRPDFPMVHILPHWNWPERVGQVTPVHVYTSGDEAELFLNGKSLGRKRKGPYEYRLRWDDVIYQQGELKAIAYKNGKPWAEAVTRTTGAPVALALDVDRSAIKPDGKDLSFITVRVIDKDGLTVPRSNNLITFDVSDRGKIVAVDNGDATSFEPFHASQRKAYNGLALVIVESDKAKPGSFIVKASSKGLRPAEAEITILKTN